MHVYRRTFEIFLLVVFFLLSSQARAAVDVLPFTINNGDDLVVEFFEDMQIVAGGFFRGGSNYTEGITDLQRCTTHFDFSAGPWSAGDYFSNRVVANIGGSWDGTFFFWTDNVLVSSLWNDAPDDADYYLCMQARTSVPDDYLFVGPIHKISDGIFENGAVPEETPFSSRVTTDLTVTASSTSPGNVDFSFGYYNGEPITDPVAFACTRFADITALVALSPICSVVTLLGDGLYEAENNLAIGHSFYVDPYITNASSSIIDTGARERFTMGTSTISPFDIATLSASSSSFLLASSTMQCDPDSDAFTESICNAALLLFVPSADSFVSYGQTLAVIPTKFPFSYFFAVITVVKDLQLLSVNAVPIAFALDLTSNPMISTTIDILSVATVDSYLGTTGRELLRTLMGYSLWIAFAVMVFHRVRMIFV